MPLRTTIAGDHDDQPSLDEAAVCRAGLIYGRDALASIETLIASLEPDHPTLPQHMLAAENYRRVVAHNAARLRELNEEETHV